MTKRKSTFERGKFKDEISAALYKNPDIRELILGDVSKISTQQLRTAFRDHVKSHLFIDDTITGADTFIFYDVRFPYMRAQTKTCEVVMYAICHRDILDTYVKEGYYGNRIDILTQMIEDTIINNDEVANSFGIGKISLDSEDIYNSARYYGCIMVFSVPNFR